MQLRSVGAHLVPGRRAGARSLGRVHSDRPLAEPAVRCTTRYGLRAGRARRQGVGGDPSARCRARAKADCRWADASLPPSSPSSDSLSRPRELASPLQGASSPQHPSSPPEHSLTPPPLAPPSFSPPSPTRTRLATRSLAVNTRSSLDATLRPALDSYQPSSSSLASPQALALALPRSRPSPSPSPRLAQHALGLAPLARAGRTSRSRLWSALPPSTRLTLYPLEP